MNYLPGSAEQRCAVEDSERQDEDFAEVNSKVINSKGQEFSLDYRLQNVNGDWKVIDVVIENISLVK